MIEKYKIVSSSFAISEISLFQFDTYSDVDFPKPSVNIITVTEWKEKESIGVIHEGIVTGEGIFYLTALNESQTEFKWEETLKFPIYLGGVIGEFFGSYVLKYIWKKNLKNLKEIIE